MLLRAYLGAIAALTAVLLAAGVALAQPPVGPPYPDPVIDQVVYD